MTSLVRCLLRVIWELAPPFGSWMIARKIGGIHGLQIIADTAHPHNKFWRKTKEMEGPNDKHQRKTSGSSNIGQNHVSQNCMYLIAKTGWFAIYSPYTGKFWPLDSFIIIHPCLAKKKETPTETLTGSSSHVHGQITQECNVGNHPRSGYTIGCTVYFYNMTPKIGWLMSVTGMVCFTNFT